MKGMKKEKTNKARKREQEAQYEGEVRSQSCFCACSLAKPERATNVETVVLTDRTGGGNTMGVSRRLLYVPRETKGSRKRVLGGKIVAEDPRTAARTP